jgi:hypothetical protein
MNNGESRVKALSAALAMQQQQSQHGSRHRFSGKPQQFYFGQNLNSLVKMSPFLEGEKAKLNKTPKFGTGVHLGSSPFVLR